MRSAQAAGRGWKHLPCPPKARGSGDHFAYLVRQDAYLKVLNFLGDKH